MFNMSEIKIANATCRNSGASAFNKDGSIRAVVPKYVEVIATRADAILDFGAGSQAIHTKYLRSRGFNCVAYDFGNNVTKFHDVYALRKTYDIVFASNVLNVQSSADMLIKTLDQMKGVVDDNGTVIMNYPSSPRKMALTAKDVSSIIQMVFGADWEVNRVGGTTSAPIWAVTKP